MRNLRRAFLEQVAQWDAPTRYALAIAVLLLVVMFGVYAFGGEALRIPAIVGIATLFTVAQLIVMWGNRRMVTPFTEAQRYYLNGEMDKARAVLEGRRGEDDVDVQELTLLGNIYRQLGELQQSEAVLSEALHISPNHHFPLYGLGRTKLVMGAYADAVAVIRQAAENGAPSVVQYDLGEALYRSGQVEEARAVLAELDSLEPYRALMRDVMLGKVPSTENVERGMPYWEQILKQLDGTDYARAVIRDLEIVRTQAGG